MFTSIFKNPKTTIAGFIVLSLFSLGYFGVIPPATVHTIVEFCIGLGLISAADGNKISPQ